MQSILHICPVSSHLFAGTVTGPHLPPPISQCGFNEHFFIGKLEHLMCVLTFCCWLLFFFYLHI